MPELNAIHIGIIAAMTVAGTIVGWVQRGNRSKDEKAAVNAGWQEQISAQRLEHDRLTEQNKALMEQVSQYSASNRDAKNRAKELSLAIQEAFARRDELQREIKDIRGNLEVAMTERDQLQSSISSKAAESDSAANKDARIKKLQIELDNWQDRLPPLIEKFRQRNEDAERLEADLNAARARILELETSLERGQTRIEPVRDPDTLTDGRDASNEPMGDEPINDDAVEEAIEAEIDVESEQDDAESDAGDEEEEDEAEPDAGDEDEDEEDEAGPDAGDEDNDDESVNVSSDNLQAIKGVGPAIEKTLNELGIFRFQQIAEMSEYDINRVANHLKGFRSRIYREDWIGQAREFRDQESGD
jgi:predicted flap endonuclease-1-like 5' DNA nuclease/predicted  nucleic acid-binding Zn-ribbon protein